jgi:hypothetical protein
MDAPAVIRANATIFYQTGREEMDELLSASIETLNGDCSLEHTDANNICLHRSIY